MGAVGRTGLGALRRLFSLVLLLAIVAAGAAAYIIATESSQSSVQLKQQIRGDAQQTVQSIRDLIEENVR